jgi:hypothetical protein
MAASFLRQRFGVEPYMDRLIPIPPDQKMQMGYVYVIP